jgi:hypothetical protein
MPLPAAVDVHSFVEQLQDPGVPHGDEAGAGTMPTEVDTNNTLPII